MIRAERAARLAEPQRRRDAECRGRGVAAPGWRSSASSCCSPRRAASSTAARPSAGPSSSSSSSCSSPSSRRVRPKRRRRPRSRHRIEAGLTHQAAHPQAGPPAAAGEPAARADRLSGPLRLPQVRRPGRKLGEDVTETLECEPRRWKVVEHVREKVSCRCCEAISQPPAPSHPIARGRAGPNLLALVLAAKYGQHLPLTRQSAIYAREGVEIDVSTLADWVGSSTASLMPLVLEVRTHVFAAERLHGDDTTVPVLAKERTKIGRVWGYVRDDRPFGGPDPPAVAFFYSPDRSGEHPERHLAGFAGILQADAYAGFNRLYEPEARAGADPRGRLLGARATQAVRAGRGQQGADRGRGGAADRRAVRDRARDQRQACRGAPGGPGGAGEAAGGRARGLAARPARAGLAQVRDRQGDRLRPQPLDRRSPGSWRMGGSA